MNFTEFSMFCLKEARETIHMVSTLRGNRFLWFHFQNGRWNNVEDRLARCLVLDHLKLTMEKNVQKFKGDISIVWTHLKTVSVKGRIMEEAQSAFFNEDFLETLDTNMNLLGCENGVLDLKNGLWRQGIPEDLISLNSGQIYSESQRGTGKIYEFLNQIFVTEAAVNNVLDILADSLQGKARTVFYTAKPNSGCSTTLELFSVTFGSYAIKLWDVIKSSLIGDFRGKRLAFWREGISCTPDKLRVFKSQCKNMTVFVEIKEANGSAIPDFSFDRSFVCKDADGINSFLADPYMRRKILKDAPVLMEILFDRIKKRRS